MAFNLTFWDSKLDRLRDSYWDSHALELLWNRLVKVDPAAGLLWPRIALGSRSRCG